MQRFFTKRQTKSIPLALLALTVSVLLAACGGGASVPATAMPAPIAAATSEPTATAASAATSTSAPRLSLPTATSAPIITVPTIVRQPTSPAATASVSAKATTASVAATSTSPKPGATREAGGAVASACDVITKADVESVLGTPVLMPPAGVPGASAPSDLAGPSDDTSTCIYVGQGKGSTGVVIALGQPNPGDPTGKMPLTQAIKGTALQPLSGIGDEAATDGGHIVITRKNGRQLAIIIQAGGSGDTNGLDAGKRLAKIGADRL
jgi:hypothetical protein